MRKMRPREVKQLTQTFTACKYLSWDFNTVSLDLEPISIIPMLYCCSLWKLQYFAQSLGTIIFMTTTTTIITVLLLLILPYLFFSNWESCTMKVL